MYACVWYVWLCVYATWWRSCAPKKLFTFFMDNWVDLKNGCYSIVWSSGSALVALALAAAFECRNARLLNWRIAWLVLYLYVCVYLHAVAAALSIIIIISTLAFYLFKFSYLVALFCGCLCLLPARSMQLRFVCVSITHLLVFQYVLYTMHTYTNTYVSTYLHKIVLVRLYEINEKKAKQVAASQKSRNKIQRNNRNKTAVRWSAMEQNASFHDGSTAVGEFSYGSVVGKISL